MSLVEDMPQLMHDYSMAHQRAEAAEAEVAELQVEVENLKHLLNLLTQDPEALTSQLLSKVNALTMVCQTRDELQAELAETTEAYDLATISGAEDRDTIHKLRDELEEVRQGWRDQVEVLEKAYLLSVGERDTARAALACYRMGAQTPPVDCEHKTAHTALQAKVARALELWRASLKARGAQYQVAEAEFYEALEALQ